ncbi:MAG: phosphodiester glycosidase family protein, partial [Candidatus Omnitrophica bacterium]|nr:phosphodiester glycosidase family protein [Candidatus Omnitrophota bacterium]
EEEYDLSNWGLEYNLREIDIPRPNRVHILRVDFSKGKAEPAVIVADDLDGDGPAEASLQNPLKLAKNVSSLAFINTNPWRRIVETPEEKERGWYEGQLVNIIGLAVSGGRVRSGAQKGIVSLWIDRQGRIFFGEWENDLYTTEGMAGFQQIIMDGEVIAAPGGNIAPRTAIGIDRKGSILWLVVVDGRQDAYSEGMTLYELACFMQGIKCWNAANMDGGGSSIMGLRGNDGVLHVVNSPSDRRIRPLPIVLTIREKNSKE